ncbi:N-acetylmuramoyl-L-alanine amidase AmiD [Carnimonas sp. R-84981]|uniref:N-acetylmuramoyl-L-alanine amidase n=1 Tax=Carnimonas bestiolae TaxID=3402172 RepID=UPI003EDC6088
MGPLTINYTAYRSPTFNKRVRFIVLHYTAINFETSVKALSGNTSSHYLVPRLDDESYKASGYSGMQVFNLVDENDRAWHAGASTWANRTNLNDTSIGIEVVNLASDDNGVFTFPDYEDAQVEALIQLTSNILSRYPDVSPKNVVAHSDIAPTRKSDPGPAFPWKRLADAGVGAWYDEDTKTRYERQFNDQGVPQQSDILNALQQYGYSTAPASTADGYKALIRAFQMHFRPSDYSGELDAETAAVLYALNDKY